MEAHSTAQTATGIRHSSRIKMDTEPEYWDDIVRSIPVCREIERNWVDIRNEFASYMGHAHPFPSSGSKNTLSSPNLNVKNIENPDEEIKLYAGEWDVCFAGTKPGLDSKQWGNTELLSTFVRWKTKQDINAQIEYSNNYFKTFNLIVQDFADEGQCSGAMFSIIKPGTIINPHNGSSKIMRCHLCLINDDNCTITVGDKTRKWVEGQILAFKDGPPYMHSVRHSGTDDRVVLIFDFDLDYLRKTFGGRYL